MADKQVLPTFGDDWLDGLRGFYIILSLKHSTSEFSMFWAKGECGYTCSLLNAGRYSEAVVAKHPDRYNDGINTVAVPLTMAALEILGLYTVCADLTAIDAFLTHRIADTQEDRG
jgi:hypothetical protein